MGLHLITPFKLKAEVEDLKHWVWKKAVQLPQTKRAELWPALVLVLCVCTWAQPLLLPLAIVSACVLVSKLLTCVGRRGTNRSGVGGIIVRDNFFPLLIQWYATLLRIRENKKISYRTTIPECYFIFGVLTSVATFYNCKVPISHQTTKIISKWKAPMNSQQLLHGRL